MIRIWTAWGKLLEDVHLLPGFVPDPKTLKFIKNNSNYNKLKQGVPVEFFCVMQSPERHTLPYFLPHFEHT